MNIQSNPRNKSAVVSGAPTDYPRNCWWVGALAEEVTRTPIARVLLETPVMFYRKEDGSVVALDDRCPHRWAPLSRGQVHGDNIVCGYHGFRFGPDGKCNRIPSQNAIPSSMRVHSYPVVEQGPFIWIWMGDLERSKTMSPPELDFVIGEKWLKSRRMGALPFKGNYFTLMENVMDLTHFGYVHAKSLGFLDWIGPCEVRWEGDTVAYTKNLDGHLPPKVYRLPIAADKPIKHTSWGRLITPALQMGAADFEDPTPAPGARAHFAFRVMHALTPIDRHQTHYWWLATDDFLDPTPAELAALHATVVLAFSEDKDMLEAIERNMTHDGRDRDYPEITVRADEGAVLARRLLAKWMAAE